MGLVGVLGLSCGGDDGGSVTELDGVAWMSGPIVGAEVTAYQLVEGERTLTLGTTTTDDSGGWHLVLGLAYEHIELEARGGTYIEATGGVVALDQSSALRGVALDVSQGEKRTDVTITPWSQLVLTLAAARHAAGREATGNGSIAKAHELLLDHLGFDPTHTPIAPLSSAAASPTESVKHVLSLAGLSELSRSIAQAQVLTVQDVNTVTTLRVLTSDANSEEALFDGNGDTLAIGTACALPDGCPTRGDECHADCTVYANTLRKRLALQIAAFLQREENGIGLVLADIQSWIDHLNTNDPRDGSDEPELFGGEPEALDSGGPLITWIAPAGGEVVNGDVTISVAASDPIGVATLTVEVVGASSTAVTDTDDTPDLFSGSVDTATLGDGEVTLRATATDDDGNTSTADIVVTVDNLDGGTLSGAVFKGAVANATVRAFRYTDGIKGTRLDVETMPTTTAADGSFTNLTLQNGYSGPILLEAGGAGTYAEESAPATTVALDVDDTLRAVVSDYGDGQALSNVAVTPLTSFAVTYYEYLRTQVTGTFAEVWEIARTAMETHFGVTDIAGLFPQAPAQMSTFSAGARYGLILVGLSRLAWEVSAQGGGDGGTFGSAMNALRVWRVLDQDLADGCWNGRAGATALYFGGSQAVTADATRKHLADMIVAYLGSAQNVTPFTGAGDVLSLLEGLSQAGPATATGTTCEAGQLFPTPGQHYDQTLPELTWEDTPANNALVRQTIHVRVVATDNLTAPTATWTSPAGLTDDDTNIHIVDAHINTATLPDGGLSVSATAVDDSDNANSTSRSFTVDNTAPSLSWPSTGLFVDSGPPVVWWTTDRGMVLSGTVTDAHSITIVAVIGAMTYAGTAGGGTWSIDLPTGAIPVVATDVTVRATDAAGNQSAVTHKLAGDETAPAVTVAANTDTTVHDERNDTVVFDPTTHRATHTHVADSSADAVLGASGCPAVYKFVYFLDEDAPLYVTENGDPNPIHWAFAVTDAGVGIDPASTQYRVVRNDTGAVMLDWTSLVGTTTSSGADYEFTLYRAGTGPEIPALETHEGQLNVEMRGADRFGRVTTTVRCFEMHPLAPALQFTALVQATNHAAAGNVYALRLLSLASSHPISAHVLNTTTLGAGLLEFEVWQASPEEAYLNLALTAPSTGVMSAKTTQVTWSSTAVASGAFPCGTQEEPSDDDRCKPIMTFPLADPGDDITTPTATSVDATYALRVFRDTLGTWSEQAACTGCAAGEYRLDASTGTAAHYVVIVAIKGLSDELTLATGTTGGPPYSETSLAYAGGSSSTTITGKLEGSTVQRCSQALQNSGVPNYTLTCPAGRVRSYRQYRMLTSASVTFPTLEFAVTPTIAATATLTPRDNVPNDVAGDLSKRPDGWSTTESPIPTVPTEITNND